MNSAITRFFNTTFFNSKVSLYKSTFYLLLIFVIAEFIVNPIGNFPLNDDWSYAKSVMILLEENRLDIGAWPAMTLATHIFWGAVFSKFFGFSFTVLRFSTLISSLIGILVLNKLIYKISGSQRISFFASLTLLFNPLYFNMSNTFMTDVNFNTLFLLGIFFAHDFFQNQSKLSFVLVFLISVLLVLLRQFGIVLPFCFFIACFFSDKNTWKYTVLAFVLSLSVFFIFKYYEEFLKTKLPASTTYKFSGDMNPTQRVFWDVLFRNLPNRYTMIFFHALFYSFPLALLLLPTLYRSFSKLKTGLFFLFLILTVHYIFGDRGFQMPNVFIGMNLGTDTFFQTLTGSDGGFVHNNPPRFELVMPYVASLFISISLLAISLLLVKQFKRKGSHTSATGVFLSLLFIAYAMMLLITESYFDRYHLPLISLALIFISYFQIDIPKTPLICQFALGLFFYLSVFGTKDYLTLHKKIWEAYTDVRTDPSIKAENINAGFEIYNWNDGKTFNWWWEFSNLKNFKYVIQYDPEPGFTKHRTYVFHRYFPYKKDEINTFIRQDTLK